MDAAENPAGDPWPRFARSGDRTQPHRNHEVEVLVMVVSGRAS
jgi:hypothetical protein